MGLLVVLVLAPIGQHGEFHVVGANHLLHEFVMVLGIAPLGRHEQGDRLVDRDDRHPLDHRAVGGQWGGDRVADHHLLVTHPLRGLRIEDANVLRRLAKNSLLGPGGRGGGGLRRPTATHAGPRQPGAHYAAKHAVGHQVTSLQGESGQPGGFATRLGGRMSQSLTFRTVGHQLRQAPVAHLSWVNSSRPEVDGFDRGCCWPRGLEGTDENPACR